MIDTTNLNFQNISKLNYSQEDLTNMQNLYAIYQKQALSQMPFSMTFQPSTPAMNDGLNLVAKNIYLPDLHLSLDSQYHAYTLLVPNKPMQNSQLLQQQTQEIFNNPHIAMLYQQQILNLMLSNQLLQQQQQQQNAPEQKEVEEIPKKEDKKKEKQEKQDSKIPQYVKEEADDESGLSFDFDNNSQVTNITQKNQDCHLCTHHQQNIQQIPQMNKKLQDNNNNQKNTNDIKQQQQQQQQQSQQQDQNQYEMGQYILNINQQQQMLYNTLQNQFYCQNVNDQQQLDQQLLLQQKYEDENQNDEVPHICDQKTCKKKCKFDTKNLVKNFLTSFTTFTLQQDEEETIKNIMDYTNNEQIEKLRTELKAFFKNRKYNRGLLKEFIFEDKFRPLFLYYLEKRAPVWIESGRMKDKPSHIRALKNFTFVCQNYDSIKSWRFRYNFV